MSRTVYYPEEFAPPAPPLKLFVFCGVVLALATMACAAWAGMEYGFMLCREARKAELNLRPTAQNPPPPTFACHSPKEWAWICKQRRTAI